MPLPPAVPASLAVGGGGRPPPPPRAGDVNWPATIVSPGGADSPPLAITSGLPLSQQQNNTSDLLLVLVGGVVMALDPATGRQLWSHATYNQTAPIITGCGCGRGAFSGVGA